MRKPNEWIYYIAGTLCLILSAFLVLQSDFSPINLSNRIYFETSKSDHRQFAGSLNKNNLRQAAVFLPAYSPTCYDAIKHFTEIFDMQNAAEEINKDYTMIATPYSTLRVYHFLNLIEYERNRPLNPQMQENISNKDAEIIASQYAEKFLLLQKPYEVSVIRQAASIEVIFQEVLGKIKNHAFPTKVTLDLHGNLLAISHFHFEYEEIARGDLMTAYAALQSLNTPISSLQHELAYIFMQSILQPVHIFTGKYTCGTSFTHHIPAIKNYH